MLGFEPNFWATNAFPMLAILSESDCYGLTNTSGLFTLPICR